MIRITLKGAFLTVKWSNTQADEIWRTAQHDIEYARRQDMSKLYDELQLKAHLEQFHAPAIL